MAIERMQVPVGAKFDPSNQQHIDVVMKKVAETGRGTGWEIQSFEAETGMLTLTRRNLLTQVAKTTGKGESYRVELKRGTKPADGEKTAAELESDPNHAGYYMTRFDPFLSQATLSKLTDAELRCRSAVAVALGVKPWDVQVGKRAGGGFRLGLPNGYVPSRHDDKMTEVAETAVGKPGWYFTADAAKLTGEIVPSDPPSFPNVISYPTSLLPKVSEQSPSILAPIPIGMTLAERGDMDSTVTWLDLEAGAHSQIGGTSGSGKALALDTPVPTPTGWSTMGQLAVGDELFARDGSTCRVVFLSDVNESPDLYRVRFDDGQTLDADAEHQWIVSGGNLPAPTLSDAIAADRLATIGAGEVSLDALVSELGSPAWPTAGPLRAFLQIAGVDRVGEDGKLDRATTLRALAARVRHLSDESGRLRTDERVMTTAQMIADGGQFRIAMAGLVTSGAPDGLRMSPAGRAAALSEIALEVARDGDTVVLTVTADEADDAVELVRSLGLHARVFEVDDQTREITYSATGWLQVVGIQPIRSRPARCIQVDSSDSSYLAGGFIPTHNTVTLNTLIAGALAAGAELALIDVPAKAVDFEWVRPLVRKGGWGCESFEENAIALEQLYKEGVKRAETLKRYGAKKLSELPPDMQRQMKPVLIIVDEVTGLFAMDTVPKGLDRDHPLVLEAQSRNLARELIKQYIEKIAAEMRFVGFKLTISTQVASTATGIGTALRTNLHNKMLLGAKATDGNRKLILRDPTSVPEVPENIKNDPAVSRGVGVAELEGKQAIVFKSFYASENDLLRELRRRGVHEFPETQIDQTRPDPSLVAKTFPSVAEVAAAKREDEAPQYGKGPRDYEAWELDPETGKPLVGFQRANAARAAVTAAARGGAG